MSQILGLLGIEDFKADQTFVNTVGQTIVYEAVQEELNRINGELNQAISVFVDETTEDHTRRFKLPGGGYMQPRSRLARPGDVKVTGGWDVAFPLFDFGDAIASDSISMAYMSLKDLNLHLDSIQSRSVNTTRREILRAVMGNTVFNFLDENKGSLAVQPLANGDAVLYPPVISAEDDATENHYLVSGYASADVSDTNDPITTIVNDLTHHFGDGDIVVFFNTAQSAKLQALTDFEDVVDLHIQPGANVNVPIGLPENLPGKVKGRHTEGAWVAQWDRIPSGYLFGIHLGASKPVIERVDPAYTGLPRGVALVAKDEKFPMETSFYQMRRGFGVGNRLNGVVMQLKASGNYDIPTAYAR